MPHAVHLVQLIVSVIVSLILLVIGIYGLAKNDISSMRFSPNRVKVTEWVLIGLGVLLLVFSIWSYVEDVDMDGGYRYSM